MFSTNPERLRFTEAFVGLIFEPMSTARTLLATKSPFILICILFSFFFVCFGPLFVAELGHSKQLAGLPTIISLLIIFWVTIVVFSILQWLLLLVLAGRPQIWSVFSVSVFSLVPITTCALIIFAIDFIANGSFQTSFFLTRGEQWFTAEFASQLIYLLTGTQLVLSLCYFCYLRVLASMGMINALFTTFLSFFTLTASVAVGAFVSKLLCPSCVERLFLMVTSFVGKTKLPFL